MDDIVGGLFGLLFVYAIVMFAVLLLTALLLNLFGFLDGLLGGWLFLPAPLSWGITAAVFFGLLHFACAESRRLRRPDLRGRLVWMAVAWLGVTWMVGLIG